TVCWVAVNCLPPLILDHQEIVAVAHRRLAAKLAYSTIALQLVPEHFTLSELQAVHEIILGEAVDKRNFRKRVLALDFIEATGDLARHGGRRPARLYRAKHPGQVELIK
ncbi:MAG: NUDIX hydrolase, partial [Phycisphaerales bacterium]|nr:NUDIX hydrolase [Phycisphaerales bacterium]